MNKESKIPKFVTDLTNYLIAIKNLSKVYVKNMTITYELDIRDNAVIHLFLNSGLRLSELKNLSIDDLNLDNGKKRLKAMGSRGIGYIYFSY